MLYAFNPGVQLVAPVTANRKAISHRVKKLKPGGETALYDAISEAAICHGPWTIIEAGQAKGRRIAS